MIVEKNWLCTPGKILSYACELNAAMLKPSIGNNLLLTFAEIKTICELGQKHSPYDQVYSIYLRLKQLSEKGVSALLNKPFCEGIVEDANPHKQLVQRSDPIPREFQHTTFTALRI